MEQVGIRAAVLGTAGGEREAADADAALVAAAQRDPAAFEALYVRYADAVHRYCARRLDDPEAAADATATVFVRALAALPRYRERSFRAWLFRIAHNEVIDDYRRSARRRHAPLDAAAELQAVSPSPEQVALAADEQATLTRLLDRLPEGQRRVIELRLSGLSGAEVAYTLGRTRTAVKMLQLRAVRTLRAALADLERPVREEGRDGR